MSRTKSDDVIIALQEIQAEIYFLLGRHEKLRRAHAISPFFAETFKAGGKAMISALSNEEAIIRAAVSLKKKEG